jgi:hypothetical protein
MFSRYAVPLGLDVDIGSTQRGLPGAPTGGPPSASGEPGSGSVPPGPKFVTGGFGEVVGGKVVGVEVPEPRSVVELLPPGEPGIVTVPVPMAEPVSPADGPDPVPTPTLPEVAAVSEVLASPLVLAAPQVPDPVLPLPAAKASELAAINAAVSIALVTSRFPSSFMARLRCEFNSDGCPDAQSAPSGGSASRRH